MAQTINTNINALTAQRNLAMSQSSLSTSMQRLSSGLRINSAKDDAAGLAIAERFTSQIRGLTVAARNANDAISLAQTAEGALGSISTNLQRMRELAVQSANATNSSSDRAALQAEVTQLAQEIDRVAKQTAFNGTKLLDGSFTAKKFQVGANANETIDISSISSMRTGTLGQEYKAEVTSGALDGTANADLSAITINGTAIGSASVAADAKVIVDAINNKGIPNVTASVVGPTTTAGAAMTAAALTGTVTINGVTTASITTTTDAAGSRAAVIKAINDISAATGVIAKESGGVVDLVAEDGRNIVHTLTTLTSAATGLAADATSESTYKITYKPGTTSGELVIAGTVANSGLTAGTTNVGLSGEAVSVLSVATVADATDALASIDAALATVSSARADLGAYQNRFSSTIENLNTSTENLSASRSRIQDADFATETANLSRAQILQQAGTAMVAQANQLPQGVLALLR